MLSHGVLPPEPGPGSQALLPVVSVLAPHLRTTSLVLAVGYGARHDPGGAGGLAHLLEHLLMSAEPSFCEAVERLGGYANAVPMAASKRADEPAPGWADEFSRVCPGARAAPFGDPKAPAFVVLQHLFWEPEADVAALGEVSAERVAEAAATIRDGLVVTVRPSRDTGSEV